MRTTWTIMKRELGRFFLSPIAYVVLTAWLLWSGLVNNEDTPGLSASKSGTK